MKLTQDITVNDFLQNYWLKKELIHFCKEVAIPVWGSKQILTLRIRRFLDGEVTFDKSSKLRPTKPNIEELALQNVISLNYASDELHRTFFTKHIPNFKFNVSFMNWMKENKGSKTYTEAIDQYKTIQQSKRNGTKVEIGVQFEYNRYTRDFFAANPDLTKSDCIKCWHYKKKSPGSHRYEDSDLQILTS